MSSIETGAAAELLRLAIIIPVFNDWPCFSMLCRSIDRLSPAWRARVTIIAVDDGSSDPPPQTTQLDALCNIFGFEILSLVCNLGHQRAIAVGLATALAAGDFDAVIVTDADGEDRPEDIGRMIDTYRLNRNSVIVGRRAARSENISFRAFYAIYKAVFRLSTGKSIDFGNFSLIPMTRLRSLLFMPESWNHLAAAMLRSRIHLVRLNCARGTRYVGASSMNLVSLLAHGMSAVSVFNDLVFTRLLAVSAAVGALSFSVALAAAIVRLTTQAAIPGWATTVVGISGIMFLQALILSVVASISLLGGRSNVAFIPAMQANQFIARRTSMVGS
jgi:glycosyltransferase involved in cell wall biosynthesis